ncbi:MULTISPECIES: EF-hand domain-containing protein [unclassified Lysobacter]|uniref:EF-hand domain-containing protein n=1 Tax=unclassified Lysobacter TaxID=2635362 RepID=UPI001C21425B|nr:EF-hand domain-containing protein [Lysobacter sp. MMG2]MBU8975783.1 EF-hand domain-containing protein [Lysobacter sp. MMG2]
MTIRNRKPLIAAAALVAVLSAPLAFAQSATPQSQDPAAASAAQPASGAPAKKSWSDVDTDKNGSLSKSEASSVPALGQVFDQADADADGALTADEYKAYVAKVQTGASGSGSGGK